MSSLGQQLRQPGDPPSSRAASSSPRPSRSSGGIHVEPEARVDLLLGRAAQRLAGGVVEDPVLGDVQAAPHRRLAQRDVVRLGAREVLQHVAELVGLDDLEVDLHAGVREHARAGVARRLHRLDQRQLGQRGRQRSGIVGGGDDVEVLDGVGLAPQRAGDLDALGGRVRAQRADDLLGDVQRAREQDARRRPALRRLGEGLEQRLLDLRAEPAQAADLLLLGGGAQRVERVDPELVVEPPRALGAEARQVHDRDQPARELVSQALGGRDVARLVERVELLFERLADAADLGHAAFARHRDHRHRGLAHGLGRGAVGDHAVGDGPVELVEVAELVEGGGDLGVGEVGHGEKGSSVRRAPRSGRRGSCPPRAHPRACHCRIKGMNTENMALVQGWADTRSALRRWSGHPLRPLLPWALGSSRSRCCCWPPRG